MLFNIDDKIQRKRLIDQRKTTRRHARERNRVKHLNHCFEVLRQHILQEETSKKICKSRHIKISNDLHRNSSSASSSLSTSTNYQHHLTNEKLYFPFDLKQEQEQDQQLNYWQKSTSIVTD